MYRKFIHVLKQWKTQNQKEPLMVIGPRQTGKTWIIRKFLKDEYDDYVYINLEEQKDISSVFDGNLNPNQILIQISQLLGRKIDENIPLFIDEIQENERAVTALKYFCESEKNYRIITAGSLLGVKLKRFQSSFPVGKVRIVQMFPMDFEEFLLACDESLLRDGIRNAYETKTPLAAGIHEKAIRLYHDYLYVGGMPQAVLSYLSNQKNAVAVDPVILENLHLAYLADMTKYVTSPAESVKINEVYQSIPRQLAKENPKFKYSEVRSRANRRDFSGPLDWLNASSMIYTVHQLQAPHSPLKAYEKVENFKVYLSDTGMLRTMCGIHYKDLLPNSDNIFKGALTENYAVQQFVSSGKSTYYFKPSESMEIDLITEIEENIIPVEIKSGRHKRSVSLNNYMKKYHPSYGIRISEQNFEWSDHLISLPLYAIQVL